MRGHVSVLRPCGDNLLPKPHKIRVFKSLEGLGMGGLPPICHRFSAELAKVLRGGLNGTECAVQPPFFYEVLQLVIFSKRSTDCSAMASVSCT